MRAHIEEWDDLARGDPRGELGRGGAARVVDPGVELEHIPRVTARAERRLERRPRQAGGARPASEHTQPHQARGQIRGAAIGLVVDDAPPPLRVASVAPGGPAEPAVCHVGEPEPFVRLFCWPGIAVHRLSQALEPEVAGTLARWHQEHIGSTPFQRHVGVSTQARGVLEGGGIVDDEHIRGPRIQRVARPVRWQGRDPDNRESPAGHGPRHQHIGRFGLRARHPEPPRPDGPIPARGPFSDGEGGVGEQLERNLWSPALGPPSH